MGICLVKCSGLLILHVLLLCMAMNKSTGLTPDGNFCTLYKFVAFLVFHINSTIVHTFKDKLCPTLLLCGFLIFLTVPYHLAYLTSSFDYQIWD